MTTPPLEQLAAATHKARVLTAAAEDIERAARSRADQAKWYTKRKYSEAAQLSQDAESVLTGAAEQLRSMAAAEPTVEPGDESVLRRIRPGSGGK